MDLKRLIQHKYVDQVKLVAEMLNSIDKKLNPDITLDLQLSYIHRFIGFASGSACQTEAIRVSCQNREDTLIVWGETDGVCGAPTVRDLLNKNQNATLVVSGGVYDRFDTVGDIGSLDMLKELFGMLSSDKKSSVIGNAIIDSWSKNTAHQMKFMVFLIESFLPKVIFLVEPLYHMPRFLLTLAGHLFRAGHTKKPCRIIPVPYGSWYTKHIAKGPKNRIANFLYEELCFQEPTESRYAGKIDCGELFKVHEYKIKGDTLTFLEGLHFYNLM